MLNEERIILMTKMASYEAGEGKRNMKIGKFFRSDYITVQVLKSIFCATIAYAIIIGLFVLYDFEVFMQDIYQMDLITFAQNILLYYAISIVVYGAISYAVCSYRYTKARKSLKRYYYNLKKLGSLYGNTQQ